MQYLRNSAVLLPIAEVLARRFGLNALRAEEERFAGAATTEQNSTGKQRRGRKPKAAAGSNLFDDLQAAGVANPGTRRAVW